MDFVLSGEVGTPGADINIVLHRACCETFGICEFKLGTSGKKFVLLWTQRQGYTDRFLDVFCQHLIGKSKVTICLFVALLKKLRNLTRNGPKTSDIFHDNMLKYFGDLPHPIKLGQITNLLLNDFVKKSERFEH